eukprot:6003609-Alexandrium_andersonii.AAC.1
MKEHTNVIEVAYSQPDAQATAQAKEDALRPWLRETTPDLTTWQATINQLVLKDMVDSLGESLPVEEAART